MKEIPDWFYGVAALGFAGLTWLAVCTVIGYVFGHVLVWAGVSTFAATVAGLVVWACLLVIGSLTLLVLLRESARECQRHLPRY